MRSLKGHIGMMVMVVFSGPPLSPKALNLAPMAGIAGHHKDYSANLHVYGRRNQERYGHVHAC